MAPLPDVARRKLEAWRSVPLTWNPATGGKRPLVCWEDDFTYDLGQDPDGTRFEEIAGRMTSGNFYPKDVIEFYGDWILEERDMRQGDRVLQKAVLPGVRLWSMAEMFVVQRGPTETSIGYVTTQRHFGRGKWQATMTRSAKGALILHIRATAGPGSFWFWIGLPVARFLMVRARLSAVKEFRNL